MRLLTHRRAWLGVAITVALLAGSAATQVGNDPLTPLEADQVRGTAGQLDNRVKLLTKFAAARLASFEKLRTQPAATSPDRSAQLYELLRQFADILPELDDAADDMVSTRNDPGGPRYHVDKVLVQLIAAEQDMLAQLHREQAQSSAADLATYHFELDKCVDVATDSLQNAQEARADAKKK